MFLNLRTPSGGVYEAYENYDYFHDAAGGTSNTAKTKTHGGGGLFRSPGGAGARGGDGHRMQWTRFGAAAPFA